MKALIAIIALLVVAQAVNLNKNEALFLQGVNEVPTGYGVQDYGVAGCCGPDGDVVDACESQLLQNYRDIEFDRTSSVTQNRVDNATAVDIDIKITVNEAAISTDAWGANCRSEYIVELGVRNATNKYDEISHYP